MLHHRHSATTVLKQALPLNKILYTVYIVSYSTIKVQYNSTVHIVQTVHIYSTSHSLIYHFFRGCISTIFSVLYKISRCRDRIEVSLIQLSARHKISQESKQVSKYCSNQLNVLYWYCGHRQRSYSNIYIKDEDRNQSN